VSQAAPGPLSGVTPACRDLYQSLLASVRRIGPFREELKKTSIHLARKTAFLGVHPRKQHLVITVKSATPIASERIFKVEQVSTHRWHLEVELTAAGEIDRELLGWIREAYELCG
jgi:hypothetical protein